MKISEAIWKVAFNLCAGGLYKRFVAGITVEDAAKKARKLREKRVGAVINILGEHVKTIKEADRFFNQYLDLIFELSAQNLDNVHIALKPSQLGQEISEDVYKERFSKILSTANYYLPHILVETDREDPQQAGIVRKVVFDLFESGYRNQRLAGQTNQSYICEEIREACKIGLSYRLTKGTAYPSDRNLVDEKEIREIFLEQAIFLSQKGNRPAIATHDLYLIDRLKNEKNLEFQVLLGIENKEMGKLADQGKKTSFYIPYGLDWRPYGERRGRVIPKIWLRNHFYRAGKFLIEGLERIGESHYIRRW